MESLIGEMILKKGSVHFKGSCSYVKQNPWIQNLSIRFFKLFII
jgi:hypothetical protein